MSGKMAYWSGFLPWLDATPVTDRAEYTDDEFCDALCTYRQQDIQTSIHSPNPIVRMFAVLDRRIGKRTLSDVQLHIDEQPAWLQMFYRLRIEAEAL